MTFEKKRRQEVLMFLMIVGFLLAGMAAWFSAWDKGGAGYMLVKTVTTVFGGANNVLAYLFLVGTYLGLFVPWVLDDYRAWAGWLLGPVSFLAIVAFFLYSSVSLAVFPVLGASLFFIGFGVGVVVGGVTQLGVITDVITGRSAGGYRKFNRALYAVGTFLVLLLLIGFAQQIFISETTATWRIVLHIVGGALLLGSFWFLGLFPAVRDTQRVIFFGPERSGKTSAIGGIYKSIPRAKRQVEDIYDEQPYIDDIAETLEEGRFPDETETDSDVISFSYIQDVGHFTKKVKLTTIDYPGEVLTGQGGGVTERLNSIDEPSESWRNELKRLVLGGNRDKQQSWRDILKSIGETDGDDKATIQKRLAKLLYHTDLIIFVLPGDDFIYKTLEKYTFDGQNGDGNDDNRDDGDGNDDDRDDAPLPNYHENILWVADKEGDGYMIQRVPTYNNEDTDEVEVEINNENMKFGYKKDDTDSEFFESEDYVHRDVSKWRGDSFPFSPHYFDRDDFDRTHPKKYIKQYKNLVNEHGEVSRDSIWVVTMSDLLLDNKNVDIHENHKDASNKIEKELKVPDAWADEDISDLLDKTNQNRVYPVYYSVIGDNGNRFDVDPSERNEPFVGSQKLRERIAGEIHTDGTSDSGNN